MTTHTGYRETMLTDPKTGLTTHVRYGFGRLWHGGYGGDDEVCDYVREQVGEEEFRAMVKESERRLDSVCGRYGSPDSAMAALVAAGYDQDEVYELEWY